MDDAALWELWKSKRDAEAFAEIVSRHAAMVHSVSRRLLRSSADAEDVAQDCFLELLRARPAVRSSLGALLHTLAVRRSLDRLKADARRRARERRATDRHRADHPDRIDAQVGRVEVEEVLAAVDQAIDELPGALRGPIVLRLLEGRPPSEAAALLGVPESTLRRRIGVGVARIRSALKRRGIAATEALLLAALGREALEAAPAGLVASLGKIAVSGGALPRIVSTKAAGDAVRPAAVVLTGAILMKKIAAFAILLLLLSAAAYRALDPGRSSPPASAPETAAAPLARSVPAEEAPEAVPVARSAPEVEVKAPPPGTGEGRKLEVLCLDERGKPVPRAEVFLVERHSRSGEDDGASVSHGPRTADEAGLARFSLPASQRGRWRVEVYARFDGRLAGIGAKQLQETEGEGAREPLPVVLLEAAGLEGAVEVPEGYDPTLAKVRLTGISLHDATSPFDESLDAAASGPLAHALETSPAGDGAFAFQGLPTKALIHLEADAPGLSRAEVRLEPDWEHEIVEIRLVAEGVLEGTLRFAGAERLADGVRIEALPITGEGSFRAAATAEGSFRIAGLPAGSYSLSLAPQPGLIDWAMPVGGPFPVSAGRTTSGIELHLEKAGSVSGLVKDADSGTAVAGISIAAVGPAISGNRPLDAAISDPAGRYSLRLPPGESFLYVASHVPEYLYPQDQGRRAVTLAPGEELSGVDFELEPRTVPEPPIELGRARGRIVDPAGRPLGRVRARAFTLHDPGRPVLGLYNRTVLTDEQGRYEVSVPAGPPVYVEAGGRLFSTAKARPLVVTKDGDHFVEDLVVRPAEGALGGLVLAPDGRPVEGAELRASSESKRHDGDPARTDATGRFRLERLLEDEPLEITVEKEGYRVLGIKGARAGPVDLRLVLEPRSGLEKPRRR